MPRRGDVMTGRGEPEKAAEKEVVEIDDDDDGDSLPPAREL